MLVKRAIRPWIAFAMILNTLHFSLGSAHYNWNQTDNEVSLRNRDQVIWNFKAGPDDPKPAFHPLTLPDGRILTGYRPDDHAWHRAHWFSWKFLNGKNFWEEDETGQGRDGITRITRWKFIPGKNFSADLDIDLSYIAKDGGVLMTENRRVHLSAPNASGYEITTTARFDVVKETTINAWYYGGYAIRLAPDLAGWKFIDDQGIVWDGKRGTMERRDKQMHLIAPPTPWMAFVENPQGSTAGIAILDHPSNPRYPVRWLALPHMPYFNPVFFADKDLVLQPGETLTLRYKVVVFENENAVPYLRKASKAFAMESFN